jgi:hypothetical protein
MALDYDGGEPDRNRTEVAVAPVIATQRERARRVKGATAAKRTLGVLGMHTEQRGETCSGQVLLGS